MKNDRRIARGCSVPTSYRHPLLAHITFFLGCLRNLADPGAACRVRWTPQAAGTAAVLMSLQHHVTLRAACEDALTCMGADFRGRKRPGQTYNGLMKALERQSPTVLPMVKASLREHVRRRLRRIPVTYGWTLLAVDGTKEELPRTRDNECDFGIADNGVFPQAFATAIVEVLTGLPWDWRIDRARAGEKTHLLQMIADLPMDALLLADGAYHGFPIWSLLDRLDKPFLIRVGGNVRLLTELWPELRVRIEDRTVWFWPMKRRDAEAPLRLRLIRVGRGQKAVYLLTNVHDTKRLSKKAAGDIYRLRWGVELFYRTFKRTFNFVKLRSKAARRARLEMEWALITMTIAALLGNDVLSRRRIDPRRLSPAQLLRTLQRSLHHAPSKTPTVNWRELNRALADCLKDTYRRKRSKQSRMRRRTLNTPQSHTLKPPIIRKATAHERELAQKMTTRTAA